MNFDVVIVGGGIVGLTCAALLTKSKLQVALIESKNPLWDDWAAEWESRWERTRRALEEAEESYSSRKSRSLVPKSRDSG